MPIAVLDIGKTNAKVIVVGDDGEPLAARSRPSHVRPGPPYPCLDLDGTWDWALGALRELAAAHRIEAVVPVAHGAAAVLMAGEEPALPALDYEFAGPDETAATLNADPFAETASPPLPAGLNVAAQLHWQETRFPDLFGRTTDILMLPQYWAWRLSGVKATEATALGAHTHLWNPRERRFSGLARRRGWAGRFPPLRYAWETLGPVRPELAAETGLPRDCRVLAGIHDSNASYLPHLVSRQAPFTVLSTGTWVIAMAAGAALDRLDPRADMLANVDARRDPVPCARFMGGREVELVAGPDALKAAAGPEDVAAIVAEGTMALPAFFASGPYLGQAGRILGEPGAKPEARAALAALYAALVAEVMLEKLGAAGPVVVEGSFHRNAAFCGLLAALRPEQAIHPTDDPSGTARGAWLLSRWGEETGWRAALGPAAAPWRIEGLAAYRERWRALAGG
jgi:sugar (pentulose or hexulose) kinase